jgi:hypothetical protein
MTDILRRYFPGTELGPMLLARAGAELSSSPVGSTTAALPFALPPSFAPPPALAAPPASAASSPVAAASAGAVTASAVGRLNIVLDGSESDRQTVSALALRARAELARRLAVSVPVSLVIRVHPSTSAFERATGQPWFALGAIQGSELHLLPLPLLRDRGLLERTLRHQLVHTMTDAQLADRPAWVREGAAVHFSEDKTGPAMKGPCPLDADLQQPISVGALSDALARARACFERQLDAGRPWRDVR